MGNFGFNTTNVDFGSLGISVVAQTGPIQVSGLYYINATASLIVGTSDDALCYVTTASNGFNPDGLYGGSGNPGTDAQFVDYAQASIADAWIVSAGDVVQLVCYSIGGNPASGAANASLTATLINSGFNGKEPIRSHSVVSTDPRAHR